MKAELSPQPGQLVAGKYRMVRVLGRGAMGVVFEAEHTGTGKRVAIKWLHAHIMESRSAVERLMREAQASARVRHSNVVDVYDIEREGDALFLVMEYLEGEPLSSLLERGGVPFHELLALVLQAMRGVAEAHRQGIVHRDIKPDNIFLSYQSDRQQPVAKVLDFGISKLEQPTGGLSLTQTGSTLGTPLYMSYEQLAGQRDVDARSDIYAFGVILYEALTGTLPYSADNFAELAAKVITTEPPLPRELRPDIPEALESVVLWAMKKQRDERPPNMGALIDALLPFTAPPFDGRVSLSSRVPSAPPATPALASSLPPPSPSLRLERDTNWHSVIERNQRSRREMEDRVTALVAGTMPEYSIRKRSSGMGWWVAAGALVTLVAGLLVAGRLLNRPSSPAPRANVTAPAPSTPSPAPPQEEPAPAATAPENPELKPEPQTPELLRASPTQVEPTQMKMPEPSEAEAPSAQPGQPSSAQPAGPSNAPAAPRAGTPSARTPQRAGARPSGAASSGSAGWRPSGDIYEPPPPPPPPVAEPVAPPPPEPAAPVEPEATPPNPFDGPDDDPTPYRAGKPREDEF